MTSNVGSSPHTWGIRFASFMYDSPKTVHPHIRGAYTSIMVSTRIVSGSSPHTWGIPVQVIFYWDDGRFIPTYVGHTLVVVMPVVSASVHPHIRGAYEGM